MKLAINTRYFLTIIIITITNKQLTSFNPSPTTTMKGFLTLCILLVLMITSTFAADDSHDQHLPEGFAGALACYCVDGDHWICCSPGAPCTTYPGPC